MDGIKVHINYLLAPFLHDGKEQYLNGPDYRILVVYDTVELVRIPVSQSSG